MNKKTQISRAEIALVTAVVLGLVLGVLIKRVRLGIILGLLIGGTIVFLSWLRTQKKD